jgi:hypothetical protein
MQSRNCGSDKPLVSIYPSLVRQSFTISELESLAEGATRLQLTDAAGRVVQESTITAGTYAREITLNPDLTSGLYFVLIHSGAGQIRYTGKIIVHR